MSAAAHLVARAGDLQPEPAPLRQPREQREMQGGGPTAGAGTDAAPGGGAAAAAAGASAAAADAAAAGKAAVHAGQQDAGRPRGAAVAGKGGSPDR